MVQVFDRSFVKGALGALVMVLVLGSGYWTYLRYQEFLVMRSVVAQLIQQSQQQARPAPTNQTPPAPQ